MGFHVTKGNTVIRRLLTVFSPFSRRPPSAPSLAGTSPLHPIQTELSGELMLHAGDVIHVERFGCGFCVYASAVRQYDLHSWPLYYNSKLRPAEDFRVNVENSLASVAPTLGPHVREEVWR